jgi:hypothetical protein
MIFSRASGDKLTSEGRHSIQFNLLGRQKFVFEKKAGVLAGRDSGSNLTACGLRNRRQVVALTEIS